MADAPLLPRTMIDWLRVFGPGAIMASLTIGTGELIFSTRGGAIFGFHILFVFALTSILKWSLVFCTSRHMILTGVHPYERMLELPGPRGWLLVMLLLISTVAMPIWISFHSGVLGNLMTWLTGTAHLHGGMDYAWGAAILAAVLILSATGGYEVLEKTQTFVVLSMVLCACLTLVLYKPDWLELFLGLVPHRMSYPGWLSERYPNVARHSEWVEVTRYIGVIGGAGFDYLSYTSWLREKRWGVLPGRATPQMIDEIAADPNHVTRKWINAPLVDCAISFLLVIVFSAVFVASGAMFLGPEHVLPDEDNLLNLQARFVTQIHPWLLPLYVIGAFLTMLGTLYGTVEIACSVADEILRSFIVDWSLDRARRLRRGIISWCATVAFLLLGFLFMRQSTSDAPAPVAASRQSVITSADDVVERAVQPTTKAAPKPKILLKIMTLVNLFTGVLSCGLICMLTVWMDRRWLPVALRPPVYFTGLNLLAGLLFLGLGIKGYWDNENRLVAVGSLVALFFVSVLIAVILRAVPAAAIRNHFVPFRRFSSMTRIIIPSNWQSLLAGAVLGSTMMGFGAWVNGDSKPALNSPIGEKFWPSEFGAEDQRGAANRMTPQRAIRAAQLIKQGRTFQLGRLYEQGMPIPGKRHFSLTIPGLPTGLPTGSNQIVSNDELVSGEIGQVGTQFDGLGHVGIRLNGEDVFYNGNKLSEFGDPYGLKKLGVENVGVFFTRAILFDVCALRGNDRLPVGYVVTPDDLAACLEKAKLQIEEGDVALIRTGHGKLWMRDNQTYGAGEPGLGLAAARYLTDHKVAMIGADTWAIEAVPHENKEMAFPVHQWNLTRNGVYHLENLDLEEIANAGAHEFCFVFSPLRLKGATGSPGNPIAIH